MDDKRWEEFEQLCKRLSKIAKEAGITSEYIDKVIKEYRKEESSKEK